MQPREALLNKIWIAMGDKKPMAEVIQIITEIKDESSPKKLKIAKLQNHFPSLSERDEAIAWDKEFTNGSTLLIRAATKGYHQVVEKLIQCKVNINKQNQKGETALMRAAYHGHTDIVHYLVVAKAMLDIQDKNGDTAILYAAEKDHFATVQYLIDAKMDVNKFVKFNDTLLMLAVKANNFAMVYSLIKAKVDLNQPGEFNDVALVFAAEKNNHALVKLMVDAKADVNKQGKDGCTALIWAARKNNMEMAQYLAQAKADVNKEAYGGSTALLFAVKQGDLAMVQYLTSLNANVNIQNLYGSTALMFAAYEDRVNIVDCLIHAKAELKIVENEKKKTAFDFVNLENLDMMWLFIQAGEVIKDDKELYDLLREADQKDPVVLWLYTALLEQQGAFHEAKETRLEKPDFLELQKYQLLLSKVTHNLEKKTDLFLSEASEFSRGLRRIILDYDSPLERGFFAEKVTPQQIEESLFPMKPS